MLSSSDKSEGEDAPNVLYAVKDTWIKNGHDIPLLSLVKTNKQQS